MDLIQVFKNKLHEMAQEDARRSQRAKPRDLFLKRSASKEEALCCPQNPSPDNSRAMGNARSDTPGRGGQEPGAPSVQRTVKAGMALKEKARRKAPSGPPGMGNARGIALFMVIAAISVLSVLVTEFVYVAQLNQRLAFDALDGLKAHYLAKSGLKLSLLRLKAYQIVKEQVGGGDKNKNSGIGAVAGVSPTLLNKIWSFPFMYPIPTGVPGLSLTEKEQIEKFQKASGLEGSFTALIESESSKYNLNSIVAGFGSPETSPSPSPSASPSPNVGGAPPPPPNTRPSPSPSGSPQPFKPEEMRNSLQTYLTNILQSKFDSDPDFAAEYRDFRMEDFMDNLVGWADPTYERKQSGLKDQTPMKHAPFYSVSELHMLPGMDDDLYNLFAPALTVSRTPGININTMQEATLRALVPSITDDEVTEFFKFRDSTEEDNSFKTDEDFFKYLSNSVAAYQRNEAAVNKLKDDLKKRNIRLVTDETEFKITVRATVNQAVRTLEAWVTLGSQNKTPGKPPTSPGGNPAPGPSPSPSGTSGGNGTNEPPDAGLKVNFMRIS